MFTLAHLSDPHLAPLPQPRWIELIGKRVTGYINWQRKRRFIHDATTLAAIVADLKRQAPDHIAVTGDIANIGLPAEIMLGRDWLDKLGTPRDVTVVPGNHDIYVLEAAGYVTRQWGAHMSDDDGTGGFPFVRRRGPLALIGVTTGVPTPPFFATGSIGTKQLTGLTEILDDAKNKNLFRVVLIHHPPVTRGPRHKRLLDAAVFKRIVAAHGVDLVIHGHDHVHMLNWLDGLNGARVPALGVPSASAAPGKAKDVAAYHLYRIDGAPGAWRCEVISRGMTPEGKVVEEKKFMLDSADAR